jgi:DNA invertase Pin-like site-specific DNA recombinase
VNPADQHRIAPRHLERSAIVYIRQSDPQQVREHTESTRLQRGLREKAISLGWSNPTLLEDDQGITASGFADRPGFQWLLTQVTLRKAGILFCIEASRLSRNSRDWAHLFEMCGYFDTLVADPQQVYDVAIPNDRLVLQIKGTVAELELSNMKTRLRAGIEAKAASGELKVLIPPGAHEAFARDLQEHDQAIEQARLRVQSAQYAADRAFEQYDLADPKNRLVADNLEKRLNEKLADLQAARAHLEQRHEGDKPLTEEQRQQIHSLARDFPGLWTHQDTPTTLRKQLLRSAIREIVVIHKSDDQQLEFTIHWEGDACTQLTVKKRATPVGSRTDGSLVELITKLCPTLDDGEIARILNMKELLTPRDLPWTKDRVKSFRAHHRIRKTKQTFAEDVLTGQQARQYLGIGYNGLLALIRRGLLHTHQLTDFAPWRIPRAELDSEEVQKLVRVLKKTGRCPAGRGSPETQNSQTSLFPSKSRLLQEEAL